MVLGCRPVTRLWAGQSGVLIPAGARDFCVLQNAQTGCGSQTASHSTGTGGSFAEVKRPQREGNHSPPSSAEVENEWSRTSALPLCLDVDGGKFL